MGDAEIIPIGTRGRPGRGTGTRPSAAARNLAPGAPGGRGGKSSEPTRSEEGPSRPDADAPAAERPATESILPLAGEDVVPLEGAERTPAVSPRLEVSEREAPGGIP